MERAPLGVSMVHLHARNGDETPAYQADRFATMIVGIRESHPDLVITVTTSGRTYSEFEQRSAALDLVGDAKPDMARRAASRMRDSSAVSNV